jgi:hypothetical protein
VAPFCGSRPRSGGGTRRSEDGPSDTTASQGLELRATICALAARLAELSWAVPVHQFDSPDGNPIILPSTKAPKSVFYKALRHRIHGELVNQPKVKSNAPTSESRNSISKCRSAIGFACRIS